MSKHTNLYISIGLSILFVACLFLPVLQFSFGMQLNGILAFTANFSRIFLTNTYGEYLVVMSTVVTPILHMVLIGWSFRKQVNLLPLAIVSFCCIVGAVSWLFKYNDYDVILYGYYVWFITILLTISFIFIKNIKNKKINVQATV